MSPHTRKAAQAPYLPVSWKATAYSARRDGRRRAGHWVSG